MTRNAPVDADHIPGAFQGSIFNPVLITVAVIYLAWSWVHLPSSIWVRCLFACYLILRMKPDIIIPFVLSCYQLRVDLAGRGAFDDGQDMAIQMTGFEQYAFFLPCCLYFVRPFFAALSARVARRADFPFWLYGLYLLGVIPVVIGALAAREERSWTTGMRDYFVVGMYFYGLLMPACSRKQLMQVVFGFAIIGLLTVCGKIALEYHSRQLWVLLPIAGSFAPIILLTGGGVIQILFAGVYSLLGFVFAAEATFTLVLLWVWNTIAGACLEMFGRKRFRSTLITGLLCALLATTLTMFFYAALTHDPTKELHDKVTGGQGTTYDRMTFKLLSDRGPIWWAAMCHLTENVSILGSPAPKFYIRSLDKTHLWVYSTHSILLDPLLRLGLFAGPLVLLILSHGVLVARSAIARDDNAAIAVLGLAVISNIVLGGATLPYMLNERAAEHMYMVAGLLAVYGGRRRREDGGTRQPAPRPDAMSQSWNVTAL